MCSAAVLSRVWLSDAIAALCEFLNAAIVTAQRLQYKHGSTGISRRHRHNRCIEQGRSVQESTPLTYEQGGGQVRRQTANEYTHVSNTRALGRVGMTH
jgi:hypothetical protein